MAKKAHRLGTDWFVGPDWKGLLASYQDAPSSHTSTPLLEALAQGVTWCLETLEPLAPHADPDDLSQQLLVELLEAAAGLPSTTSATWIPVRLLERARREVFRWLQHQSWPNTEPIDPLMASDVAFEADVLAHVAPIATEGHLYDKVVNGISYVEQADLIGLSPAAVRKRANREAHRLARRHSRTAS